MSPAEVPLARALRRFVARTGLPVSLWVALLLGAAPAQASFMLVPPPNRPKDFAVIKKDGLWHVYYIRRDVNLPLGQTENDFGHAVTNDLYHFTQLPPVLQTTPSTWDNLHVWAPSVVKRDGLYWMLYTGVSSVPNKYNQTQRMGLAVSSDLLTWTRFPEPVLAAADVPWAWVSDLTPNPAFRDPYVMPDPLNPSGWLAYYTVHADSDTVGTLVGVAQSAGDLSQWQDLKPLWITHQSQTFNVLTESPHVFRNPTSGLYYLMYTTSSGQPLTFATSMNPTADPPGWTYRGRLRNMLGFDTSFWYASEVFTDGTHSYFAFVSGDRIEFREIIWIPGDWRFFLTQPSLFHVQELAWDRDSVRQWQQANLRLRVVNALSGAASVEAVVVDGQGAETVVPSDSIGVPSMLFTAADSSVTPYTLRRWPATTDSTTWMTFRLRTTDRVAQTGLLQVGPPTGPPPPDTTFAVLGVGWDSTRVHEGDSVRVVLRLRNPTYGFVELEALVGEGPGAVALPADSIGVPSLIPGVSDTTRVWVRPRRWPATTDTTTEVRVMLRLADRTLDGDTLRILPPRPPAPPPDTTFAVLGVEWSLPEVLEGDSVDVVLRLKNPTRGVVNLVGVVTDLYGVETLVPADSLNVPPSIPGVFDTTRVRIAGRRWPSTTDSVTVSRVRVQTLDGSVASGDLLVRPRPDPPGAPPPSVDPYGRPRRGGVFYGLQRAPIGEGYGFALELSEPTVATIAVFDLQGRLIRTLANRSLEKGLHVLPWDLRDDAGRRVGPGLYFGRVRAGSFSQAAKVLVRPR